MRGGREKQGWGLTSPVSEAFIGVPSRVNPNIASSGGGGRERERDQPWNFLMAMVASDLLANKTSATP
jgi:hypothetical protein